MSRQDRWQLALVLGLALALRLALWAILPRERWVSDEPEYLAAAGWLAQGRGFSFYNDWPWLRPPAYLLFLAPWVRFFGLDLTPIRLAQIALSLSVPALVYALARRMLSSRAALPAGLIAALWLPLATLPHLVLAENLFLPLLLAGFYGLVRFQQAVKKEGSPRTVSRAAMGWTMAGGAFLGLATLTRGLTVGFLPLAALWVFFQADLRRRWRALVPPILLAAAAALVILPWTGYNYLRYHRLILVDTTGGYNFWLGTQGGQFHHLRQVNRTLLELPDPAARQAYAYEQGLAALSADPAGFLRNRITEAGQLLRINYSADERLLEGFSLGEVSIPHLLVTFTLEDTLYVLLVPLALLGLLLRRGEAGRGLVLLWLGYNLLMAVAFFAISRFRLPLGPFLALYAAALAGRPWRREESASSPGAPRSLRFRLAAAGLLSAGFWAVALPSYLGPYPASLGATSLGVQGRIAAGHLARAQEALRAGRPEEARREIEAALSYRPDGTHPVPTAQVVEAERQRALGRPAEALRLLEGLEWYQADLLRGDILRAQGDLAGARAAFGEREVVERNPTAWAWEHLEPPAGREIDLGDGLDWGWLNGFYSAEREDQVTYRWSGEEATLRFPRAGQDRPLSLKMRLRGWRPEGAAPAQVVLLVGQIEVARFVASAGWQEVRVTLPATPAGEDVIVTLCSTAFFPGPQDLLLTGRLRMVGVMVDWAVLED